MRWGRVLCHVHTAYRDSLRRGMLVVVLATTLNTGTDRTGLQFIAKPARMGIAVRNKQGVAPPG